MDIRAIVLTPNGGIQQVASVAGGWSHATVDAAKQSTASLIGGPNKASYGSGYDVAIFDIGFVTFRCGII